MGHGQKNEMILRVHELGLHTVCVVMLAPWSLLVANIPYTYVSLKL